MMEKQNKTKEIIVVSNTHWDREFRHSFEKTRRALVDMMDTTIDILLNDDEFASYTMDGHSIMIEDYLRIRPERENDVRKLIENGRLIIGPYYTLVEQFSVTGEAIIRNLIKGKQLVEKYGGKYPTVAYTPASWGQTGQLPQILKSFGLDKMMFYRGVSHHETPAEYIWEAPDGSKVLASRFALYARYNWYYQVHRAVTRDRVFDKTYKWGEFSEIPCRRADDTIKDSDSYQINLQNVKFNEEKLEKAITDMLNREEGHFTTDVFLAMNGHDISVAHPLESKVIKNAQKIFENKIDIKHGNLEEFWEKVVKKFDFDNATVLSGERRAHLKEGMWTFLFPATISARTYLKQQDYDASIALTNQAEPLAVMAGNLKHTTTKNYLDKAWKYLLSNHTHDANGGCAPDVVCSDIEYRYRKVKDISQIVIDDSTKAIIKNLSNEKTNSTDVLCTVFNSLPYKRDVIMPLNLEMPLIDDSKIISVDIVDFESTAVETQIINSEQSSVFMDSIWDVPTIMDTQQIKLYAQFKDVPALGYKTYIIKPNEKYDRNPETLLTGINSMENQHLKVVVNGNGTVTITDKKTNAVYKEMNYLIDQGEVGNAWEHQSPEYDSVYNSKSAVASVCVENHGRLHTVISASFDFIVPKNCKDGIKRSSEKTAVPVKVYYTLKKDSTSVDVKIAIENNVKDHWLRACFDMPFISKHSIADSHYDIVSREIQLEDSSDWVEENIGTHPLQTFVSLHKDDKGVAVMPKGLFEYEVLNLKQQILALSLIRGCRIKLAVSEEKQTELADKGIQCLGKNTFEYSITIFNDENQITKLPVMTQEKTIDMMAIVSGQGQGTLPLENGFIEMDNDNLAVTCIKPSECGEDIIIRFYNPSAEKQKYNIKVNNLKSANYCEMGENAIKPAKTEGNIISGVADEKKIVSLIINAENKE